MIQCQKVRAKMLQQNRGDRALVDLLLLTREAGLDALETACDLALESGVVNGIVLQNEVRRLIEPTRPKTLNSCDNLKLTAEPQADCQRYDHLLGVVMSTDLLTQLNKSKGSDLFDLLLAKE